MRGAYVVSNGRALPSAEQVDSFNLRNLGLQLRYRWEFSPLSYFYAVYARGGYALDENERATSSVFADSFRLRDAEQFFVKLSYRFNL